jgi:hypothetical protein
VGDGSNVRRVDADWDWKREREPFQCHHFGFVRKPSRLREKWRILQGRLFNKSRFWFPIPPFLFDCSPHNWKDPHFIHDLQVYEGPYINAVRNNPQEFVRDCFVLYEYLCRMPRTAV